MRCALLTLCVVGLVASSGCVGPPASDGAATDTVSETVTVQDTGTACPYTVYAEPATTEQRNRTDRRVDFENLSEERRDEFERMVETGSVRLDTLSEAWSSPVVVTYRDEEYYVVAATC
jgi:hypothetical protein